MERSWHASGLKSRATESSLRSREATVGHTNSLAVGAASRTLVTAFGARRHLWALFTGIRTSWALTLGSRTIRDIRTRRSSRASLFGFRALPHSWALRTSRALKFSIWARRGLRASTTNNRLCSLRLGSLGRSRDARALRTIGNVRSNRARLLNIRAAGSLRALLTGSWAIRTISSGRGAVRDFGASWTFEVGALTSGDYRSINLSVGTYSGNIGSLVRFVNGASFGAVGSHRASVLNLILVVSFIKEFIVVVALQAFDIASFLGALVSGYFLECIGLESSNGLLLCAFEGAGRCVAVVNNIHVKPLSGLSGSGTSRCTTVGRLGSRRSDGCARGGRGAEGVTERLWCLRSEATVGNAGVNVNLRRTIGKVSFAGRFRAGRYHGLFTSERRSFKSCGSFRFHASEIGAIGASWSLW